LEILEFARERHLQVDEFISITMSSRTTNKQRRIDELLSKLGDSDTLIVAELSRLGRSTSEVIALITELVQRHIRVLIIK
jgi:DNA invertase Pin-like site-specific DNA recombinase